MIQVVIKSGMVWEVLCNNTSETLIDIEVVDMDNPSLEMVNPTFKKVQIKKNREKIEKEIEETEKFQDN